MIMSVFSKMESPQHCQSILLRFLLLICDLIFRKGHGEVKTQVTLERKEYNYGKPEFYFFFRNKIRYFAFN